MALAAWQTSTECTMSAVYASSNPASLEGYSALVKEDASRWRAGLAVDDNYFSSTYRRNRARFVVCGPVRRHFWMLQWRTSPFDPRCIDATRAPLRHSGLFELQVSRCDGSRVSLRTWPTRHARRGGPRARVGNPRHETLTAARGGAARLSQVGNVGLGISRARSMPMSLGATEHREFEGPIFNDGFLRSM